MTDTLNPPARARAEVVAAICERIRTGTPINHAGALERVAKTTLHLWRHADPEVELLISTARAEAAEAARSELQEVARGKGMPGANANVLLHLLERAHPDEYAPPKQRVETTGADGGPQKIEHSGGVVITNADAKRIARKKQGT